MYCIKIDDKNKNRPIIILEGHLDNSSIIESELIQILNKYKNSKEIAIDFKTVLSVSDSCLLMFQNLRKEFPIQFRDYSLYIETLLNENRLINI